VVHRDRVVGVRVGAQLGQPQPQVLRAALRARLGSGVVDVGVLEVQPN